jgi:phenylacetate-coenzyme A ligase PaaK-like adenylate-forming protein
MDAAYQAKRFSDIVRALRYAQQLASHERWSRDAILRHQQKRLSALVRHAVAGSEFYRELYHGLDVENRIVLAELPIIDKPMVMANFDRLVTDRRLKLADLTAHLNGLVRDSYYLDEYRVLATAGTSGFRGVFVFDRRVWGIELANALRWHRLMGITPRLFPRQKISAIGADSPVHVSARLTASGNVGLFRLQLLEATMPIEALVAALNAFQPEALLSYSSLAAILAEEQRAGRLSVAPRVISTHSELLTEEMARKIERAWGIKPFNHYGLTELSTFGAECERHCGMHMLDDLFIAEVVDNAYRPVEPGQVGQRLLLTNLYNFAQPLIRYEVSDMLALAPEPCLCGRPFPLISSISGRAEEVVRLAARDGREIAVSPLVFSAAIEVLDGVAAFQLSSKADVICVRAVPGNGADRAALPSRITAQLADRLNSLGARPLRIEVELVAALERISGRMGKVKLVQTDTKSRTE